VCALLLAGLLLAAPAAVHATPAAAHATEIAASGEGDFGEDELPDDEGARGGRLRITAWGGEAWATSGSSRNAPILGGEVSWALSQLDLGFAGYGYQGLSEGGNGKSWDPVLLVRITQRFETYRGIEAGLTLGAGSARRSPGTDRPPRWEAWFQLGLGLRIDLGPVYLAGELAFEQNNLIHLTGGLGVKLF
jgi:hypothetical protein